MFAWLRDRVRAAVLAGVHDALTELDPDGQGVAPDVLADLRRRLTPALAGPEVQEQTEARPAKKRASVA